MAEVYKNGGSFTATTNLLDDGAFLTYGLAGGGDAGKCRSITNENMATLLYAQMGLGSASKLDTGISNGKVLTAGDIGGDGPLMYRTGSGILSGPEGTAFNKYFLTSGDYIGSDTNPARSDHGHEEFNNIKYGHTLMEETGAGGTIISVSVADILESAPSGTVYINPIVDVSVFLVNSTFNVELNEI
jgi:hypothetical protein